MSNDSRASRTERARILEPSHDLRPDEDGLLGRTLLHRYRLIRRVGSGGMAHVYLAEHVALDTQFAVKILRAEYAQRPQLVANFLAEAKATSKIRHENVVRVTDCGDTGDGVVFFVMEYLEGEDLCDILSTEDSLNWPRVASIALQVCAALAAAHDAGVVHRDIKPENCFLTRGLPASPEHIKLLDFGIAQVYRSTLPPSVTLPGLVAGTPGYMPPEQLQGEVADIRVDVYGVGALIYALLTGDPPFVGSLSDVISRQLRAPAPPPSENAADAELAPAVDALVARALEREPSRRFQSVREMSQAIARAARPTEGDSYSSLPVSANPSVTTGTVRLDTAPRAEPPPGSHRVRWILKVTAGVVVAVVAAAAAQLWSPRQLSDARLAPRVDTSPASVQRAAARRGPAAPSAKEPGLTVLGSPSSDVQQAGTSLPITRREHFPGLAPSTQRPRRQLTGGGRRRRTTRKRAIPATPLHVLPRSASSGTQSVDLLETTGLVDPFKQGEGRERRRESGSEADD
ncbi:MAG: serine/threonine-protein kinase [Nannocystaceae bacterium]